MNEHKLSDFIIEKAKAAGWKMMPHGNAYATGYMRRPRYFHLYPPKGDWVLGVSIAPCSRYLTREQIIASAWDELLEWIDRDKLLRLIDLQEYDTQHLTDLAKAKAAGSWSRVIKR